jgi:hypothetical protein
MTSRFTRVASTLIASATIGSVAIMAPATAASAAPLTPTAAKAAGSTVATKAHTEERRKNRARASRSMFGVKASAYRGSYYDGRFERTRKCIVRKESGGNYRIASRYGTYKGAYQFNSYLARATAKRMGRSDLAGKPMNQWSRYDQDRAFWTVWNHGRGARNWPTRYGC